MYTPVEKPGAPKGQWMMRGNRYKLIERVSGRSALYDLETDPDEFHNLIEQPELAAVREQLRTALLHRIMVAGEKEAGIFRGHAKK